MTAALAAMVTGLALVAGPLGAPAGAAPPDSADAVQVFNRDVFEIDGVTLRNPDADTSPDARLFTNTGISMETTWGEWSAASATSTVRTTGPRTDVRLQLNGLVPEGLYTVFWGTFQPDSEHPLCPGVERTLPLDAFHPAGDAPAPNAFVAGPDGAAQYRGQVGGALLDAGQVFFSIVYQFYGETSYPFPNRGELVTQGENCRSSFGEDAMRHLLVLQKF